MIAALTPGQNIKHVITRRKSSDVNIAEKINVDIMQFHFANYAHRNMKFQELPKTPLDCDRRVDILWELSFNFKQATPNWQGMMHTVHQGKEHPGQSSVVFLPINRHVFWGQDMHSIHIGVPLQSCN